MERHDEAYLDEASARVSLLAVGALVLSLLCFVPVVGLLAALLGVGAIVAISRSRGRLRGTWLGVAGLSIGLVSTVVWTSVGMWTWRFSSFYLHTASARAELLVSPGAEGWSAARAVMTESAAAATSDADFEQFVRALQAHYGAFVEAPREWGPAWKTFAESLQGSGNTNPRGTPDSLPIPVRFANGSASVFVVFVKDTWMKEDFRITDAFAILPGRNAVTLREDGPGKREALNVGFAPVYGEGALPSMKKDEGDEGGE
ncbi:MAG: DUF4190 domain-containing protein [Phycisphaerales bacterium]